jgi:hypothetical protein
LAGALARHSEGTADVAPADTRGNKVFDLQVDGPDRLATAFGEVGEPRELALLIPH